MTEKKRTGSPLWTGSQQCFVSFCKKFRIAPYLLNCVKLKKQSNVRHTRAFAKMNEYSLISINANEKYSNSFGLVQYWFLAFLFVCMCAVALLRLVDPSSIHPSIYIWLFSCYRKIECKCFPTWIQWKHYDC